MQEDRWDGGDVMMTIEGDRFEMVAPVGTIDDPLH